MGSHRTHTLQLVTAHPNLWPHIARHALVFSKYILKTCMKNRMRYQSRFRPHCFDMFVDCWENLIPGNKITLIICTRIEIASFEHEINSHPSNVLLCSVNFFLPIRISVYEYVFTNNWWWDRFLKHEIRGKGGNTFRKLLDLNIGCNSCAHKYIIWKNKNWRLYVFLFLLPSQKSWTLKFGFSEKATNFEKNLRRTFDKRVVICARNCTCQKVDEDFSKQMWSSRIIQTLTSYVCKN